MNLSNYGHLRSWIDAPNPDEVFYVGKGKSGRIGAP